MLLLLSVEKFVSWSDSNFWVWIFDARPPVFMSWIAINIFSFFLRTNFWLFVLFCFYFVVFIFIFLFLIAPLFLALVLFKFLLQPRPAPLFLANAISQGAADGRVSLIGDVNKVRLGLLC